MSSRRKMLDFLSLSRLPSAYQEVEYIEKDYQQWINTQYANTSRNQRIVCDYIDKGSGNSTLFGSQKDSTSRSGIYWANQDNLRFGIGNQPASYSIGTVATNVRHIVDYSSTSSTYSVSIDGVYLKENVEYSGTNITERNIYLFANNYNNSLESQTNQFRLYFCEIYDNDVLVRNFIPCYRKADNEIGLYDLVNGVFYTNAGVGTFTKGPNV